MSSEETKERHQQPPDSTKQAESHVEELFGPLKQLFDEAHQQHPSPLAQQQDQDSSIWTHQQPPSVVKEDPFSVPVFIITQEEVEPPPDHWEDDITASLVPSAVLNVATQDQKTFSCIVESMPQEDVSAVPPQHVLLTCGEDLWQLFKDGKHQFSITAHKDDSSNLPVPSATVSDSTVDDFKVLEAPKNNLCKSPPSKEDDPFPFDEEWGDTEEEPVSSGEEACDPEEDPKIPQDTQEISHDNPKDDSSTPVHLLKPSATFVAVTMASRMPHVSTVNYSSAETAPEDVPSKSEVSQNTIMNLICDPEDQPGTSELTVNACAPVMTSTGDTVNHSDPFQPSFDHLSVQEPPSELATAEKRCGLVAMPPAKATKSFPDLPLPAEVSVDLTEKKGDLSHEDQEEEDSTLPAFLINSALKHVLKPNGNAFSAFSKLQDARKNSFDE